MRRLHPRTKEMAGEKEMACVFEATAHTRICGQQQLGKCWCAVAGVSLSEKFSMENYMRIKYFRTFSVYENIFTTKKVNYGSCFPVEKEDQLCQRQG